jgi:hypothetical protein
MITHLVYSLYLQAGQEMNFGSISIRGKKLFSSVKCSEWLWGVHNFLSSGYVGKATGCEPDHCCPCGAKVKNVLITPTSPCAFMVYVIRSGTTFTRKTFIYRY